MTSIQSDGSSFIRRSAVGSCAALTSHRASDRLASGCTTCSLPCLAARAVHHVPPAVSVEFVARWLKDYFDWDTDRGQDRGDVEWLLAAYVGAGTVELKPVADYRSWDPPTVPSRRAQ